MKKILWLGLLFPLLLTACDNQEEAEKKAAQEKANKDFSKKGGLDLVPIDLNKPAPQPSK